MGSGIGTQNSRVGLCGVIEDRRERSEGEGGKEGMLRGSELGKRCSGG